MMHGMLDLWDRMPAIAQDLMVTAGLLLPIVLVGLTLTVGHTQRVLVASLLWRYRASNALFIALIAVSVGIGTGLLAQERALRSGTARAADKFDLVGTAPGSEVNMMLATVYLQPTSAPLLSGEIVNELVTHEHVELTAPLAFGDNFQGAPIVGTTAEFVTHLSADLVAGRLFKSKHEAIVGAKVSLDVGDEFEAAHGLAEDFSGIVHGSALREGVDCAQSVAPGIALY